MTYLDILLAELREYEAQRTKVVSEPPSVWRDYALKAWQWSIGVKQDQIEREREQCSPD